MARKRKLKTLEQVREEFSQKGETFVDWARQEGFSPMRVYDVVQGRTKCKRGEGHRIAVALGIKQGEIQTVNQ